MLGGAGISQPGEDVTPKALNAPKTTETSPLVQKQKGCSKQSTGQPEVNAETGETPQSLSIPKAKLLEFSSHHPLHPFPQSQVHLTRCEPSLELVPHFPGGF